jgi:uncharacterized GH25 family protein
MLRPLLLVSLIAGAAAAHDFWLRPAEFVPAPGTSVAVQLMVGEGGAGEPVARDEARLLRFALIDAEGERPLAGRDGADPAGFVRVRGAGAQWLVFTASPAFLELEAAKFEAYLQEEGLDAIAARRAERGEAAAPAREIFRRCAKALLHVGAADAAEAPGDARAAQPVGLPLELVPLRDPAGLRFTADGAELTVRLLWQGQPLEGALVKATRLADAAPAGGVPLAFGAPAATGLRLRTDERGEAVLHLPRGGAWFVGAEHMREAEGGVALDGLSAADPARQREAFPPADYESFWASLTFEAGAP